MKSKHYFFVKIVILSTFIYSLTVFPCNAQITPDTALPKNSTTRLETDTTVIEGGTQAGNNLFHSLVSALFLLVILGRHRVKILNLMQRILLLREGK